MICGNYLINFHITQISPILRITYGKFKCHMVTNINQVTKLKYHFMTFNKK